MCCAAGGRLACPVRAGTLGVGPGAGLAEHTGLAAAGPAWRPGIFAMASEERTRELLSAAGFEPRRVEQVEMVRSFESPDDHWHYVMDLAGALAMAIGALPERGAGGYPPGHGGAPRAGRPAARLRAAGVCLNVLAE